MPVYKQPPTMHSVKLPEFGQHTPRHTLVSITSLRQVHRLVTINLIVNLLTVFVIWRLSR